MTRKEETEEMINAISEFNTEILLKNISSDSKRNFMLNQIATVLADIAISLSIICDKYNKEEHNEENTNII